MRAAVGVAEALVDPLDHLVGEGVTQLVRVHVRLGGRVTHEVREEALDDPVLAHDTFCSLGAEVRENGLLLIATLHEAVGLEALQHLACGGPRDAEHLGHTDAIAVDPVDGRYSPIGKARK